MTSLSHVLQVSRCVWREISVTCVRRSSQLRRQLITWLDNTPPHGCLLNFIVADKWSLPQSASTSLSLSISLSARSVFGRLLVNMVLGWSRYSRYKFYLPHNAVRVRNMLPYSVTGNVASLSKPLYPLILFHRKSKTRYTCSLWWQ